MHDGAIIVGGAVQLSLVVHGVAAVVPSTGDGGRAVGETDLPAGETRLLVIDLPPIGAIARTPQVVVLANGTSAGWRRAALQISRDGAASWEPLGGTALPATIGVATTTLSAGQGYTVDRVNHVDVVLAHAGLGLEDADAEALAAGANLAMVGDEAFQFGRATPLGGAAWRLSELWRARAGTEAAMAAHVAGEGFALLRSAATSLIPAEDAVAGAIVSAQGVGDTSPVKAAISSVDRALRPLSPVRLSASRTDEGVLLSWTRRSRDGFAWRDGVDAPLAEEREAYRITTSGGSLVTDSEVGSPEWLMPAGIAEPDTVVTCVVRQLGSAGLSDPSAITVTI